MSSFATEFFRNRVGGRAAAVGTVVRVLSAVVFAPAALAKFVDLDMATRGMAGFGYPATPLLPLALGVLEMGGALLLLVGLGTRLVAFGLGLVMIGATVANVRFFPEMTPLTVVLFVFMAYLLWAGPGALAVDNRLRARLTGAGPTARAARR
ncbi:DoxX family protein [Pseudonocardia acaciae]|uniref:DoxX family protein n=1 Tax=Pseudonocardia acaciae TaxID=551276 RepID=UPI0006865A08|nr:DoxX family protein [Pseudonocardia acaciae]